MKCAIVLSSIFIVAFATSCSTTSLSVNKLKNDDNQVRKGFVYPLLFTQFEVKITRGIASCEKSVDENGAKIDPPLPDVRAFVKAEISVEHVNDADHMYVIDSDSLSSATKITNLTINWEKGRLTSINTNADDQTAEIIRSVLSGVGTLAISSINPVAAAGAIGEVPAPPPGDPESVVKCNETTAKAVANVAKQKGKIEAISDNISKLTQNIIALESAQEKIGPDPQVDCNDESNSKEVKCKLKAAIADLEDQQNQLSIAKAKHATSLQAVTYESIERWPSDSKTPKTSSPYGVTDQKLEKWVHLGQVQGAKDIHDSQKSIGEFKKEFDIHFQIAKVGTYGVNNLETYSDTLGADAGIRYRLPASGYMVVCKRSICTRDERSLVVAVKKAEIHQLGHIFNVPFVSKPFTNNELVMKFDSDGIPTMASMSQKESSGENIAGVFETFSDDLASYRAAQEETKKSELEQIQEQTALLTAQSELVAAQNALNPSDSTLLLTDIKIETDLAEAQKKYLDALKALEPELPPAIDENEQALAVIQGETTLLQAEAARLEAILTLRKAKEALLED